MKYNLIVKSKAEIDLLESANWYENQKPNLGKRLIEAVDEKLLIVQSNPLIYQLKYRNTRTALVKRFPFAVHFIVEEKRIVVLAILSTHRNPKIWKGN